MYTGEAKEQPLPRTDIHAMSKVEYEEDEEPLAVEHKGSAASFVHFYTLANSVLLCVA